MNVGGWLRPWIPQCGARRAGEQSASAATPTSRTGLPATSRKLPSWSSTSGSNLDAIRQTSGRADAHLGSQLHDPVSGRLWTSTAISPTRTQQTTFRLSSSGALSAGWWRTTTASSPELIHDRVAWMRPNPHRPFIASPFRPPEAHVAWGDSVSGKLLERSRSMMES
jgi:hypothetical protein